MEETRNLEKFTDDFIKERKNECPHATTEEIRQLVTNVLELVMLKKPDGTPEEWVRELMQPTIDTLEGIRSNYSVPGYNVLLNVGNIDAGMYAGYMDSTKERPMVIGSEFDIASMTKSPTQTLSDILIDNNAFNLNHKIRELHPKFINVQDLTVDDIKRFAVSFRTPGRIDGAETSEEALNRLYLEEVSNIGYYNYNDMGMMTMKEVMEYITNMPYEKLVNELIVKPLGLKNTHLIVPDDKIKLLTGSPNWQIGAVNDGNANAFKKGFSGHAGLWMSPQDWVTYMNAITKGELISEEALARTYTSGRLADVKGEPWDFRSLEGNYYTSDVSTDTSFTDVLVPKTGASAQGSTRCLGLRFPDGAAFAGLNPSSISKAEALKIQEEKNLKDQVKDINMITSGSVDGPHISRFTTCIDSRKWMPVGGTQKPIVRSLAELRIKLLYLQEFMNEYNYANEKDLDVKVYTKVA